MKPEDRLHLLAPYLPTDRFRAALEQRALPSSTTGAALQADLSGFTRMVKRLVAELGPLQAGEELRARLNPMFEAVAGQVFHHGGSVIRFLGDGFLAWFDDAPNRVGAALTAAAPGVLRAAATGLEMQAWMRLFPDLGLKVFISAGYSHRWAVGDPSDRLFDVISGPAVCGLARLASEALPGQVLLHCNATAAIQDVGLATTGTPAGHWLALSMRDSLAAAAREQRWPAWESRGTAQAALDAIRPFVERAIRAQNEGELQPEAQAGELRTATPVFFEVGLPQSHEEDFRAALDSVVRALQDVLKAYGGRLMSVETPGYVCVLFAVMGLLDPGDRRLNDVERAIYAALEFQQRLRLAEPVSAGQVRAGISRGLLYAGTIGGEARHDYSIIGDETNRAARLMGLAAPGQILVSAVARSAAGPGIAFQPLEPMAVKGHSRPLPVFAVERAIPPEKPPLIER